VSEPIEIVHFDEYIRFPNPMSRQQYVNAKDCNLSEVERGVLVHHRAKGWRMLVPWTHVGSVHYAPPPAKPEGPKTKKAERR